jgi:hypothetical protein
MATRATSLPLPWVRHRRVRVRNPAPMVGVLVVLVSVASLATALARLPADVSAPRAERLAGLAALRTPERLDPIDEWFDPVAGATETSFPKSPVPVGGFAFVRCTNLWTANADGSNPRRILSMPGISSPTFSPDGRTIAFLAAGSSGTQIWLAAADGSATRRLGTIAADGAPVLTNVGPLAWSPDGDRLAFALLPPALRGGVTTHWTLDLSTGLVGRIGEGGDEPVWLGRQVLVAGRTDGTVQKLGGSRWSARRLSKVGGVRALAFAPGWWAWEWEKQTALLLDEGGSLSLSWQKGPYATRSAIGTEPPAGFEFDPNSRLAVLQHGTVAATLLDETGERDLGLFDPLTFDWTTLDYAWDAAGSPAPATLGSLEEQMAVQLARDVLWSLGRPDHARADLLLAEPLDPTLVPFGHVGYAIGDAVRKGGAWTIPAHTYGRMGAAIGTRDVAVTVRDVDGRLAATLTAAGPIVRLRTVDEAARYLDRVLTVPVIAPAGVPEGTRLAKRWAIEAWTWRGRTTGTLNLNAPGVGRLSFYYGEGGLGCGAYPIPLELETGTPAIMQEPTESGGYNAIAWPAGPKETSGPFGIQGQAPTAMLVSIANAMDGSRRSG